MKNYQLSFINLIGLIPDEDGYGELMPAITDAQNAVSDYEEVNANLILLQKDYGKLDVLAVAEKIFDDAVKEVKDAENELKTAIADWEVLDTAAEKAYNGDFSNEAKTIQEKAQTKLNELIEEFNALDPNANDGNYDKEAARLDSEISEAAERLAEADLVVLGALGNYEKKKEIADNAAAKLALAQAKTAAATFEDTRISRELAENIIIAGVAHTDVMPQTMPALASTPLAAVPELASAPVEEELMDFEGNVVLLANINVDDLAPQLAEAIFEAPMISLRTMPFLKLLTSV